VTLSVLGQRLGNALLGVPVIDKTGITTTFNFIFEFVLDENTPRNVSLPQMADDPASVPRAQSLFTALEGQLGLQLEPARAPREFIVIDAVERPSAN
jgi:uncharacterized protein (TIGR03435 family)